MNDSTMLDDLERDIVCTLAAKADQVVVDDAPFRPEPAERPNLTGRSHRGDASRSVARRLLAVAAAVVLIVGGLALARMTGTGNSPDMATRRMPIVWAGMPEEGPAAFVPSALPEGWTLTGLNGGVTTGDSPETWQLFGPDGPSPMPRGVLVSSTVEQQDLGGEPSASVNGAPVRFSTSGHPLVPDDAIELAWDGGEVFHQVIAVGMTEAELLDFLESLVPRADPATGFDAPPGATLPQLDAATTDDESYMSTLFYARPGGDLMVASERPGFGAGLLHRLVGEVRRGGGLEIRDGDEASRTSVLWADGWMVDVTGGATSGELDRVVDSLRPMTRDQLVDLATAEPVTARGTVGDWTIELRGNALAELGMCLTKAGSEPACTTVNDGYGVTGAAAVVDGQWVVVVVTDGAEPARVETAPSLSYPPRHGFSPEPLRGERGELGDRTVEVVTIPEGVDSVAAPVSIGGGMEAGPGFQRPRS